MSFTASAKKWRAMGESNGGKVVDQKKIFFKENMIGKRGTKLIGGGFWSFREGFQPFFV